MKKYFYSAAVIAACVLLTSCTSESVFDSEEFATETESVNKAFFDREEEKASTAELMAVIMEIVNVHKDFENFQEVLPRPLLGKMLGGKYKLLEGVEILRYWYEDDECYDVMCEWPTWDVFIEMLPTELLNKFEFYL